MTDVAGLVAYMLGVGDRSLSLLTALTGFSFSSHFGVRLPKSILYASPVEGSMSMRSLQ